MNKKDELIKFLEWVKINTPPHKMYTSRQIVDLYLINSFSQIETQNIADNEQAKECLPVKCYECGEEFENSVAAQGHRCRLRRHG